MRITQKKISKMTSNLNMNTAYIPTSFKKSHDYQNWASFN